MGWFAKIAWSLGMCICGSVVMSMFGSQIRIVNTCARKLMVRYLSPELFDIKRLKRYFNRVIIRNFLIITAASLIVFFFVPTIGIIFYCIGMFINWITSIGAMGLNPNNIDETFAIFHRYVRLDATESKEDIEELLAYNKEQLLFEVNFKSGVYKAVLEKKNK